MRKTFENDFFFSYTGIANSNAGQQRIEFTKALREHGWSSNSGVFETSANWFDAFDALRALIAKANAKDRLLIFGGIPYYLRMIEKRYSLALNVDLFADISPLERRKMGRFTILQIRSLHFTSHLYVKQTVRITGVHI